MMKVETGDPYVNLATAIVVQAANDYVAALKKLKRHHNNAAALQSTMQLEEFFYSRDYGRLTSVDPDFLISRLRKKVEG